MSPPRSTFPKKSSSLRRTTYLGKSRRQRASAACGIDSLDADAMPIGRVHPPAYGVQLRGRDVRRRPTGILTASGHSCLLSAQTAFAIQLAAPGPKQLERSTGEYERNRLRAELGETAGAPTE